MKEKTKCDFCLFKATCVEHVEKNVPCKLFFVPHKLKAAYAAFLVEEVSSDD